MNILGNRLGSLVVAALVIVMLVGLSACGRKKKRAPVPLPVAVVDVAARVDAGVVADAGGVVDAGVVDAGVVDAGVVDAGVVDARVVDAGVDAGVGIVDAGGFDACAEPRSELRRLALAVRKGEDAEAALRASTPFFGSGICRMDVEVRRSRAELVLAVARKTVEPRARRDLLAEGHDLVPSPPNPALLVEIGDAADDANDLKDAIARYQQALPDLAPRPRAAVQAKIARLEPRLAVEAGFASREAQHFVARYEGEARTDLADAALARLEEARARLLERLELAPKEPITVVLYTGTQFQQTSSGPDWSGGVFDGKIRIRESQLRLNRGELEDLLSHEFVHALLSTSVARPVPSWFNEGLAQFYEPGVDRDKLNTRMQAKAGQTLPTWSRLSYGFGAERDRKAALLLYDCALDLVYDMVDWRGERAFVDLFKEMNSGRTFAFAFDKVYGMDLALFEGRWRGRRK